MSLLWTSQDMIAAMNGRPVGVMPMGITGISIDSRSITPGEAFFAIKGDRVDGHAYASIAMANGAALLVVSEAKLPALGRLTVPMIVVDDVLVALGRLGVAARARVAGKVIAVTGSVGKTTTKEMLRQVLAPSGRVHASAASFNNHWGVPLTLARMPQNTDFGVFEIGMNHFDEIRPLVKLVQPDIAVITNIGAAHLGNFSSLDDIAVAKSEIFEGIVPGGHALINRDSAQFAIMERAAQNAGVSHIHTFGANARAEFRLAEFDGHAAGSTAWVQIDGSTQEVLIGAPGRHIAENAVAALGIAMLAGADLDGAKQALAGLKPEKGRGEQHKLMLPGGPMTLIDESYNANPSSMRAAIALLAGSEPGASGRRIAILGDMLEMGEFSERLHAELAQPLREAGIGTVWLAGPDMAALRNVLGGSTDVEHRQKVDDLIPFVVASVRPGDVVMVKSSKGTGCGRIVDALLKHFPAVAAPGETDQGR
jgi:UDP-N-acetylmuramoyl-tripeptide--D-alanyl-D-alanine ligase